MFSGALDQDPDTGFFIKKNVTPSDTDQSVPVLLSFNVPENYNIIIKVPIETDKSKGRSGIGSGSKPLR
jgi:predicted sugar kinase